MPNTSYSLAYNFTNSAETNDVVPARAGAQSASKKLDPARAGMTLLQSSKGILMGLDPRPRGDGAPYGTAR